MKIIIQRLTVNSRSLEDLISALERIKQMLIEGEKEGFAPKCKWWISELEVDD